MTNPTRNSARPRLVLDRQRCTYLGDVGAPGCSVGMTLVVDESGLYDGIEVAVLHQPGATKVHDVLCAGAPHEQLGPLPAEWRVRVHGEMAFRCGRRRSDGQPCRAQVRHHGEACCWHRDQTEQPPLGAV